ncbi:hypothetical protein MGN70_008909 [Eutypa lata]|nr:hypothetical protein MGN70_008909 [Eutypa lata]
MNFITTLKDSRQLPADQRAIPCAAGSPPLPKLQATAAASADKRELCHLSFVNSVAHLEVKATDLSPDQSLIERCNDKTKWNFEKQYFLAKLVAWFCHARYCG